MFFDLGFKFKMAGCPAKCLGLGRPFWQIGKKPGQNGAKCVLCGLKCVLGGWGQD